MLTKKQAKTFFVGGTLLFSGVFLWLTVDTVIEVKKRPTNKTITPEVVRGKLIWEDNNCMGCHSLFGEGAYYAPELTKVVERRGADWIRVFIKDPEAMYPGQRKMVKYDFSENQISDLIAFFQWAGTVDLNGFPAKPPLKKLMQPDVVTNVTTTQNPAALAQPQIFSSLCSACHVVGGKGGNVGPALDDAFARKNVEEMIAWLKDPQKIKPGTTMPKLPLTDSQINELVSYLQSLGAK